MFLINILNLDLDILGAHLVVAYQFNAALPSLVWILVADLYPQIEEGLVNIL